MVAALSMFALQVGRSRATSKEQGREIINGLQEIPHLIEEYLEQQGPIQAVEMVKNAKSVLFLGRGISAPVASPQVDGNRLSLVAYPAGEMKHGPIALLKKAAQSFSSREVM